MKKWCSTQGLPSQGRIASVTSQEENGIARLVWLIAPIYPREIFNIFRVYLMLVA